MPARVVVEGVLPAHKLGGCVVEDSGQPAKGGRKQGIVIAQVEDVLSPGQLPCPLEVLRHGQRFVVSGHSDSRVVVRRDNLRRGIPAGIVENEDLVVIEVLLQGAFERPAERRLSVANRHDDREQRVAHDAATTSMSNGITTEPAPHFEGRVAPIPAGSQPATVNLKRSSRR